MEQELEQQAQRLRAFNRDWTRRIGVLGEHLLDSPFSLSESRLLWELAQDGEPTATQLAQRLQLDLGYLSRMLAGLKKRGLLKSRRAPQDGRQQLLSLSAAGRRVFAQLDAASQAQAAALLQPLSEPQRQELIYAGERLRELVGARPRAAPQLRAPRPGELGWVVARHGALYAQEWGYGPRFEALVARIVADFIERFEPAREAAWVAEGTGGALMGSVMLVQARDAEDRPEPGVAQLRLLLVEPAARGLGLGRQLVAACTAFARQAGYRRIRLWTQQGLGAARHLYAEAGYRCMSSEAHADFGKPEVAEHWELELQAGT